MSKKPFHPPDKTSRLTFTKEERADPNLSAPIKKAEQAANKLDKAQSKIPKQKKRIKQRTFDAETGKAKVHLFFEEVDKPKPPSKISHSVKTLPQRELLAQIHKEIRKSESDNVGVEAAHKSEQAVEFVGKRVQSAYHSHTLKPYRQLVIAEKRTVKAEVDYLYKKSLLDNPQTATNPLSRWQQKQAIKKQYAAARSGKGLKSVQNTAENAKKAAKQAVQASEKVVQFIARHKKGILIILGITAVLMLLMSAVSSCSIIFEGGFNSIIGTSYTSEDEDIIAVDADYTNLESALRRRISNIESEYSGYDEYRYNLAEIGHNPHELASYLTALLQTYKPNEVQAELQRVFDLQYKLTLTPVTEVRYRTETHTDSEGNSYSVEVPYNYYILNIKLENFSVAYVANTVLNAEQLEMYRVYRETKGNKPYLFGDYAYGEISPDDIPNYRIPGDALSDPQFAALIKEAEKYLGYPYVWGGSTPSTSFDCSGFVCWVLNQSGVASIGRTTAQGIYNQCAPVSPSEAKPGDIIFFTGTYDSVGAVSHVGFYVGGGMMLHCGNPISYASINDPYWQKHFYAFGRIN